MTAVVFLGPTLPRDAAMALLPATYLPPAAQGDLFRAVRDLRPAAVGLVDGRFLDTGAVWHREILWALTQGVHVFGAASMGALRAAELAAFGMRGVGRVFAAYRDGCWPGEAAPFEDDDEVAVVHAPPAFGAVPLSDAMVDLRATLAAAEAAGVIGAAERCALAAAMKRLHFPRRSFAALAEADASGRLAAWLPAHAVSCKREDAMAMLREMAELLATSPPPFVAAFAMQQPLFWRRFVAHDAAAPTEAEQRVLDRLARDPDAWRACARAALGRLHDAGAEEDGPPRATLLRLRQERGLPRRDDLIAWMAANGLDEAGLERLLRQEAAIERRVAARPPELAPGLARAMLDHLVLTGDFAALAP